MITKPPIDELAEIAGNKYVLFCVISKRAKELNEKKNRDELSTDVKTISYAAEELSNGTITIEKG
ncbi:MAG: DNA-directed RNA polymerase subunit omega [Clostridia bacterium]